MTLFPQFYLHRIYQGVDYQADLILRNPDGSVVDLTGADVEAAIASLDGTVLGEFLITILDEDAGRVRVRYPSTYPIIAPSRYLWQLLATLPSEGIRAYYAGDVQVFRNIAIAGSPLADANAIELGGYPIDFTDLADNYILKFDLATETWYCEPDTGTGGGGGGTTYTFTAPLSEDAGVVAIAPSSGSAAGSMSAANFTKLAGIATGATANATDAQLRDRTTHTGFQAIGTVTGLQTALDGKETSGAATSAIASHVAETDPHTQYATTVEVAALTASSVGAQPSDADLTAIAAITTTGFVERTGSGTATARVLTDADIPNLPASKITSGTINDAQIPSSIARDSEVTAAIAGVTTTSIGAQPVDSDLTAIAALSTTSYGRSLLTLVDAAALLTETGAQPLDSDLTSIAALSTTTIGRSLLAIADAAAGRTILGSQQLLSAITSALTFNDQTISRYSVATEEVTATSYTLVAADNGKQKVFTASTAIAVSIPTGLPTGFNVILVQGSTGQITVSGSGVTVSNRSSQLKTAGQNAAITILQGLTTTVYRLFGDTAA